MKKIIILSILSVFCLFTFAQAPQGFNYQAVYRDVSGNPIINANVAVIFSLQLGTVDGTEVFTETHIGTTNDFGLLTLVIGSVNITDFSTIDWSSGPYFLKVNINGTPMGVTQLLSVPYALHAKTVASYPETDPTVKAITGIVKSNGTTISAATAGTDYLTPTGSAASLTNFPILNQNTTGNAATVTTNANLTGDVTSIGNATTVTNAAVIGKVLTGFTSGAGTVTATDNILSAIQKLDGNIANVAATHSIGESYGGGIVFYVYDNGQHGLIAATTDQSTGVPWTNHAFESTVSNAVRDGINGGLANTERIIIQAGAGSYAAQLCANYKGGNYADWYLPSKYELNLLYLQKDVVGGFADIAYWSSTEYDSVSAWGQYFNLGNQSNYYKYSNPYVRAVRAF